MCIHKVLITQPHLHLTVEKTLPPIRWAIFQPKHNTSPSPTEGMQTENACIVFKMFCVYTGRKVGTELKRRKTITGRSTILQVHVTPFESDTCSQL